MFERTPEKSPAKTFSGSLRAALYARLPWDSKRQPDRAGSKSRRLSAEIAAWTEAIRARYPRLGGFQSPTALVDVLEGKAPHLVTERLRRHLGAALLNLTAGRLSSFTQLTTGERVADLVERAHLWLSTPGIDPAVAVRLAAELEVLNEGVMFARA